MIFFNISAFFFTYFSLTAIYVIFLPKILQMLHYTPVQIGIVFAMAPLMRFIVPFLFLKYIKLNQKIFYISLSTIVFSALLFYFTAHDFYLFMIPNILIGASAGLVLPYIESYALEHLGKKNFGRSRLYGSIGFMLVGIVLAKNLESYITGFNYYLFFAVALFLFGSAITYKNTAFEELPQNKKEESFNIKDATYIWISLFFMQVSFGAFYNFFTIYQTAQGISLETISYMWAFGVVCEIVFFYFQAPLLKLNLLNIVKFSVFMTVIRWLILFLFPDSTTMSFVSQSFHAISFALHHTAAISLLYTIYKNKKLASQFYYGFSFGLGGFSGAIIAGYFYGGYLYLYAAFMALLSFLALFKHKTTATELKQNS